jgi:hypothetical protein
MTHTVSARELTDDNGFIVAEDVLAMTSQNGGKWLSYRLVTSGEGPEAAASFIVRVRDRNSHGDVFTNLTAAVAAYNAA